MTTSKSAIGLLVSLSVAFATAAIGAAASVNAGVFYRQLEQPSWAPPSWVFGPVWSVLYLLMGIAAWLVWRERGFRASSTALTLYIVQLGANALWSWLFFGWRLGRLASIEVVVLWALVLATVLAFWRLRRAAGILLLPYLGWVTFAAGLCFTIWRRNPGALGS